MDYTTRDPASLIGHKIVGEGPSGTPITHLITDYYDTFPAIMANQAAEEENVEIIQAFMLSLLYVDGVAYPFDETAQLAMMTGRTDLFRLMTTADDLMRNASGDDPALQLDPEMADQWTGTFQVGDSFGYDMSVVGLDDESFEALVVEDADFWPMHDSVEGLGDAAQGVVPWLKFAPNTEMPIAMQDMGADPQVLVRYHLATAWSGCRWADPADGN